MTNEEMTTINSSVLCEQAVLGAACNPVTTARTMSLAEAHAVDETYFNAPEAKQIWQSAKRQWLTTQSVDACLIMQELPAVAVFLKTCIDVGALPNAVPTMLERLVSQHLQQLAIALAQQLWSDAKALPGPEAIANAESAIAAYHLVEQAANGNAQAQEREQEQIFATFETLHQKRFVEGDKDFYIGCGLPWEVLNACYTGVKPGLHIIAARPSQGKTALAVTMSLGLAMKGTKQLFFMLDMARSELLKRYGCFLGQVPLSNLERGATATELSQFRKGQKAFMANGNIRISTLYHIDRILSEIYRAVKCDGVEAIWIDYLQIIDSSSRYGSQKERIDEILQKLKQCALALNIPIFLLCQLNRDAGKDPNRQPSLTDLGDSGKIERDASTVAVLWKDPLVGEAWKHEPPIALAGGDKALATELMPMWLLLLKNQQGPTAEVPFVFYKPTFTYRPADNKARPIVTTTANGKKQIDRSPCFARLRDDFLTTRLDENIKKLGALGKRGS